jgi:hypothetical protein
MPSIIDITVKKADGTTDVTYTKANGASGDNPARWFAPALGATAATRPELRVSSKQISGRPNQYKVVGTFMYPFSVLNSTTGITSVEKRVLFRCEGTTDFDVPSTVLAEAVAQAVNLYASAHLKAQFWEGAAAA